MKILDFRSDTVTLPTDRMFDEITRAKLGDDVYGDDETTNKLESLTAKLLGKEAGLFVPSGTMGNLIAIMTHTKPGQEVILEESCHIYIYEVAGMARIANVQAKTIRGIDGVMDPQDILRAIRGKDIHFPKTGLITLENTHNVAGGMAIPLENMEKVFTIAGDYKIPVHLDGARIFNAALSLNVDVKEIAQYTDSVMLCFSKGLSAPVGSILLGNHDFIRKARKFRKMLGGGMRQSGVLTAAAIVSIEDMIEKLSKDHDNAKLLAREIKQISGIRVDETKVHTNIINVDFSDTGYTSSSLVEEFRKKGLLVNARDELSIRFVTHKDVDRQDVLNAIKIIREIIN